MSAPRLVPTRSNLLRARGQLDHVRHGADAVSRKRQALVTYLFRIAKPAIDTRTEIARQTNEVAAALLDALAADGLHALRAVGLPPGEVEVEVQPAQIWGVPVADVAVVTPVRRTLDARGTPPGSTSRETVAATDAFETLVDLLISSAAGEMRVARLAAAVAATSQQLRMLRERVEPQLVAQIAGVARTLEEREREEHLRLKHLRQRKGTE